MGKTSLSRLFSGKYAGTRTGRDAAKRRVESLEPRMMLAGDVTAVLNGGLLSIEGSNSRDYVQIKTVQAETEFVQSGVTSVELDVPLLEAVGLELTGATGTVPPAPELPAGVGFPILESSDFRFLNGDDFTPLTGVITHSGTVTFDVDALSAMVEVGNFNIGFDADRAGFAFGEETTSGFFVEDTVGGLGILFDVSAPEGLTVTSDSLQISGTNLLVSPEFAAVLETFPENSGLSLTGADVGDAQIDANTVPSFDEFINVRGLYGTYINGAQSAKFIAADVTTIDTHLRSGSDYATVYGIDLTGDLNLDLGSGYYNRAYVSRVSVDGVTSLSGGNYHDRFSVRYSELGHLDIDTFGGWDRVLISGGSQDSLSVDTGSGWDRVALRHTEVDGDADINLGSGFDRLSVVSSDIDGTAFFDGGRERDRLDLYYNALGELDKRRFEWVRIR